MTDEPMTQVALRLPEALLERVKKHAIRLQSKRPGSKITKADAFRALILSALDRAERGA